MKLKDKVGLVTGASQGIGRSIALRLAAEGMGVAVLARNEEKLHALAKEIESQNGRCLVYPADLSLPSTPGEFVAATVQHFGEIDLLANNPKRRNAVISLH
jgi:3-oxoacyl-[acyl-carrier protein] reductase